MAEEMRVGCGWDRHALMTGETLMIGGIEIPGELGCKGHSDADAALHAVIDALLGAAGRGDIGQYFPSTDSRWEGASSSGMLESTLEELAKEGFRPVNLDLVVMIEKIRLDPHREKILGRIGELLPSCSVNVKFKTGDGMGPVGRGEAVEARAVVLLRKS